MTHEKVRIGQILGGFGLKGEVKVKPFTDQAEKRFTKGSRLSLASGHTIQVRSFRRHQKWALLAFEGYPDLTSVEALLGQELFMNLDSIDTSDGVYFFELKGAKVYDEHSTYLGEVIEVLDYPAHPVLRVQGERQILIPYVPSFILDFDKTKKVVTVRLLEGL